jgi:hypothetical protein
MAACGRQPVNKYMDWLNPISPEPPAEQAGHALDAAIVALRRGIPGAANRRRSGSE